jgi:hypothetical protein
MVIIPNVQYIFLIFVRQTLAKKLHWLFLQIALIIPSINEKNIFFYFTFIGSGVFDRPVKEWL